MAEGFRERGRDDAESGGSSDWFVRELGDGWVEVEPGIYERRPETPEAPAPRPTPEREKPLNQDLLENLPLPAERDQSESEDLPQEPSRLRRWSGR